MHDTHFQETEEPLKTCTGCNETKTLNLFHNSTIGKYGRTSKCKECIKEQNKVYSKNYYQRNKNKLLEKQKEYNKNNKEKIREYHKKYYGKD